MKEKENGSKKERQKEKMENIFFFKEEDGIRDI